MPCFMQQSSASKTVLHQLLVKSALVLALAMPVSAIMAIRARILIETSLLE